MHTGEKSIRKAGACFCAVTSCSGRKCPCACARVCELAFACQCPFLADVSSPSQGIRISKGVCVCVCMFTYLYIHTYVYIYNYVHAHTHTQINAHASCEKKSLRHETALSRPSGPSLQDDELAKAICMSTQCGRP
jgi:hypothetical protein